MASFNANNHKDKEQAEKLQSIRAELGITIDRMASNLGVSVGTLRKWLTGERKMSAIAWQAVKLVIYARQLEDKIKEMSK